MVIFLSLLIRLKILSVMVKHIRSKILRPINQKIILDRTGMMTESFLKKCIKSLEKLGDRGILAGMGEILDEKQKDWVKAKLRSDTIFLLKTRLGSSVSSQKK